MMNIVIMHGNRLMLHGCLYDVVGRKLRSRLAIQSFPEKMWEAIGAMNWVSQSHDYSHGGFMVYDGCCKQQESMDFSNEYEAIWLWCQISPHLPWLPRIKLCFLEVPHLYSFSGACSPTLSGVTRFFALE